MKPNLYLFTILILLPQFALSQIDKRTNKSMTGPYLGLSSPGNIPEIFAPGIVSKDGHEFQLVASPDGRELYYSVLENGTNGLTCNSYWIEELGGSWTTSQKLPFSGTYEDAYLGMSMEGDRLYFQSNRPIDPAESVFSYNIWYSDKDENGWKIPRSIGKPINGILHTSGPSIDQAGEFFFTRMAIGGINEIYVSKMVNGTFQQVERLPNAINSSRQQFDSYVSPDGRYLVFGSYMRADSYGGTDLYVAFRDNSGRWLNAINLGPKINTSDDEGTATISADGKYMFFSRYSYNPNKNMDIYWISTDYIDSLRQNLLTNSETSYQSPTFHLGTCYPNPVRDHLEIPFYSNVDVEISLSIFDLQGRKMMSPFYNAGFGPGANKIILDMEGFRKGYYLLFIDSGKGLKETIRILK